MALSDWEYPAAIERPLTCAEDLNLLITKWLTSKVSGGSFTLFIISLRRCGPIDHWVLKTDQKNTQFCSSTSTFIVKIIVSDAQDS